MGSTLLAQIEETAAKRSDAGEAELRVVGIANSRRALLDQGGVSLAEGPAGSPATWAEQLANSGEEADAIIVRALEHTSDPRIFVDCTASDHVSARYEELLSSGACVVAANKRAFSGSMGRYRRLTEAAARASHAYFETTVGAGLPVLRTIRDLVAAGDEIQSVEGVFSGTLGFVLGEVMAGQRFSQALAEARALGYTEPDPREDLSGQDVVRKLVIAARGGGLRIEPEHVGVEPLLPGEGWGDGDIEAFLAKTREADEAFSRHRFEALERGRHLCYLGSVSREGASVGLTSVGSEHPCFGLRGTDSVVIIHTRRYPTPVVIRGAGAGPEVTAAGVLADILTAVRESTNQGVS